VMDELLRNIQKWIDRKVDALAADNPRLMLLSPRLKKGLYNYIAQNKSMIEPLMPFITDENGGIDIGSMKDEIMDIWNSMPQGEYDLKGFKIYTDKSSVKIEIPKTPLFSILLGDIKTIKFNDVDIEEFLDLFKR
jgi:hypothetical protein